MRRLSMVVFVGVTIVAGIAIADELPTKSDCASAPQAELRKALPGIFAKAADHYRKLDAAATPLMKDGKGGFRTPHGYRRDKGELDMRSVLWWTAGHFPGSLWYLYEATGDAFFRDRALSWTELVAPNAKVTSNHDVGFIMYCSYGNARRLLKTDRYDALLRETADSLCKRYNPQLGLIRSWGKPDERKNFLVIPDNLMNLELLEACAHMKDGPKRFAKIARSHADVTMRHHFRPDGGCFHVLDYDQETKRVQNIARGQGASCETAWSRGQGWAVYGYVMMYRMTALRRYLDFARKLADYALNHPNMPADCIPYWDYGAPGEERDSSAGAILASALLELSQYVDAADRARYRGFAVRQLTSLASSAYFSEGDEIGHFLLKHGTGHKPGKSEIDTPLDYGDYYFLEALLRFRELMRREDADADVRAKLSDAKPLPETELAARAPQSAKNARKLAEAALRDPIPDTSDALYEEFWSTGNRSHYQNRFFPRMHNLCALALAEAKDGKGRYLPRLAEYLTAVCDMKSWVLPAHDWSDGGRGNLRGTSQSVDLYSSEVAADLACVLRLVGDRLDPRLVARVKAEVERRVFAPLRRELAGGGALGQPPRQHWWATCENNWNAVCWDNAVCAALGLLDNPEDRAFFVSGAVRGVAPYLSGFTPDGYCSEGMGYWNYGFGHHLLMGRLLRTMTNGRLNIFNTPIQRNVAAYARAYTLCEGISPAFADGNGAVFGRYLDYVDEIWPDLPKTLSPISEFPDGQVWLLREPGGLSVAFKGGHNGELHNHNDVGSYVVIKDGKCIGGDPGGEEYTRFTFSNKRYESKLLNSYGHPVPVVGGQLQLTGKDFAAKVLSRDLSSPQATVVLDLKDAYRVPMLKTLTRTFVFDRATKTFIVRDHVEFTEPTTFETAYVTFKRESNAKVSGPYGWNVRPRVSVADSPYELIEEDIPNPNRLSPHRVGVRLSKPISQATVEVVYN